MKTFCNYLEAFAYTEEIYPDPQKVMIAALNDLRARLKNEANGIAAMMQETVRPTAPVRLSDLGELRAALEKVEEIKAILKF